MQLTLVGLGLLVVMLIVPGALVASTVPHAASGVESATILPRAEALASTTPGANWPTYLGSVSRTSNSTGEKLINISDVTDLHLLWKYDTGASATPQPIVVNGIVYEGSLNGDEYALSATNGSVLWKTFLGLGPADKPRQIGLVSTATWSNGTVYVGGGNSTLYALNAANGRIDWSTAVGARGGNYYIWTSPLVNGPYVYLGMDSYLDDPLVASGFNQYYRSNGTLLHSFNTSRPYDDGSGIWSSPSLSGSTIFVTTGNPPKSPSDYGESVIAFKDTNLSYLDSWQVPASQRVGDGDFGATPIVFSAPTAHGSLAMVVASNKNGILYGWYQRNLSLAWDVRVSNLSETDQDTIITSSWNGHYVFNYAPDTYVLNGTEYNGTLRALNPLTGAIVWQVGLTRPWTSYMYGAPLSFNGLVVVPDNNVVEFYNASNGALLFRYNAGNTVQAAVSVSHGELFMGVRGGNILALDLKLSSKASTAWLGAAAPLSVAFEASPSGGLPPYSFDWTFGDGLHSSRADPVHGYSSPGTYHVSLLITDAAGTTTLDHLTVTLTSGDGRFSTGSSALAWPRSDDPLKLGADGPNSLLARSFQD